MAESPPVGTSLREHVSRAVAEFRDAAARRREADLDCARALAKIVGFDALHHEGCASVGELGERYGISGAEARDLLDLGRGLPLVPGLEEHVRAGRIPAASGGCLGRVWLGNLQREGDDWLAWAQRESTRTLRKRLFQRLDEHSCGEPVSPLTGYVTAAQRQDFDRARQIACRKAARVLSVGTTLGILADHYLSVFDPLRRKGERRVPDTTYVHGRYIPMEVRREVYERQNGRCAIPFCQHELFLDFAHIVWHASGGSREAENLLLLCSEHHHWFDARAIRLGGTAAAPRFFDRCGRPLDERRGNEYEPPFVDAYVNDAFRRRSGGGRPTLDEALDILDGFEPGTHVPRWALGDGPIEKRGPSPP